MNLTRYRAILAVVVVALLMPLWISTAQAHGRLTVGDYQLVIGFRVEPAYQGEPNGLDLRVTNTRTNEPVLGLAETLRTEISYGGTTRELTLTPRFGQDGAYTANVLPTEAGDYTWRIWGTIEGTEVDVSMTSSPETFSAVEPKSAVAFPAADTLELREAQAAASTAQTALIVGVIGILFGVIGIAVGVLGLRARRA